MALRFRPRANTPTLLRGTTPATLRADTGSTPPPPPPPLPGFLIDVANSTATPDGEPFPTVLVQVAFFSNPLDNVPQWTDLTLDCQAISITRGRSFELDAVQAGTATFTFIDLDRTLDPTYAAGPYYGLLTTRRRIRCSLVYGGITYPRFDGFVDSWPNQTSSHQWAEATVTATDLFGWLSVNNLRTVVPAITNDPDFGITNLSKTGGQLTFPAVESCSARINKILDLWPLPSSMRQIDDGNTQLAADTEVSDSETSLNYLQRITNSETGRLFVTFDGAVAFQARDHWQTDDSQLQAQVVLSDQTGPSYTSITIDPADERYIRNRIVRARQNMQTPFVAQDPASIRTTGQSLEDAHTDGLANANADMRAQVAWLLAKYADPQPRFSSVTIAPQSAPELLFPPVLACDLGDRIRLAHTLMNIGDAMVTDVYIEAINETIQPGWYEIEYALSPTDLTVY